jgi:hypothetical protein
MATYPPGLDPIRLPAKIDEMLEQAVIDLRKASEMEPSVVLRETLRAFGKVRPVLDAMTDNFVRILREFDEPWSVIADLLGLTEAEALETYGFVDGQHTRSVVTPSSTSVA